MLLPAHSYPPVALAVQSELSDEAMLSGGDTNVPVEFDSLPPSLLLPTFEICTNAEGETTTIEPSS